MGKKILKMIVAALCAVMIFLTGANLYKMYAVKNADCIVRIAYTGILNMFSYEYYAVDGSKSLKIPERFVPNEIVNSSVRTIVDDSVSDYWLVQLMDVDDDYPYMGDGYEESTLGDGLYLTWSCSTNDTHTPEKEDLELFRKTAEFFYNSYDDDLIWEDGEGNSGLISFMIIKNNSKLLVIDEVNYFLYNIDDDGNLQKIMKCPQKGDYNYFWFLL